MRISDWSSDVCSSDLQRLGLLEAGHPRVEDEGQDLALLGRVALVELADEHDRVGVGAVGDEGLRPVQHVLVTVAPGRGLHGPEGRSEEHTSELQSLMRTSYAAFCLQPTIHSLN